MCKPWKMNGFSVDSQEGEAHSDHVRRHAEDGVTGVRKHKKGKKRFGVYQKYTPMFKGWGIEEYYTWYNTSRGRDDAFKVIERRPKSKLRWLIELSKIER